MAEKKKMLTKSTTIQKELSPLSGKPALSERINPDQSFWQRLLDNKRLFLYQKITVFVVAFLVFANGIPNGYNMDDNYYTTEANPISNAGLKIIPKLFVTHTLYDNSDNSTFDYRPVTMVSFVLQHSFLSPDPATSHFINVLIYSFICLLVFILLCLWFGTSKSWLAFFITLVYAVHPLHTEVVDNIKNRDELLATFFCLLSMISIWRWHTSGKLQHIILSIFIFSIAMLCKPTVLNYITIIPLAFYFFTDMPLKKIALPFGILCVLYAFFVLIYYVLLPAQPRVFLYIENPMYFALPLGIKTATCSYILGWYAYLHILPYPLSFYYGYSHVQLMSWSNLLPVLSLVIYLLLIFFVIKNIRKRSIAVFGATVYLVCIGLYSNLFMPAAGMISERLTLASSLGYCILLGALLSTWANKITPGTLLINKHRKYPFFVFLFILISYAGMSIARNTQWENSWVLFSHDIKHLQNSAKAQLLYGEQLGYRINHYRDEFSHAQDNETKQRYMDSILQYQHEEKLPFFKILTIAPGDRFALNDLALACVNEDSLEEAKKYLLQARDLHAMTDRLHYNLGMVYARLGISKNNTLLLDSSINEFKVAINMHPEFQTEYAMLGEAYLRQKDTTSAINTLLLGARNIPDSLFLYTELAKVYQYKNDTERVIYYYERGAQCPRPDPELLQFLKQYFHSKNDIQKENYYRDKLNIITAAANSDN